MTPLERVRESILSFADDNRENVSDLLDAYAHELAEHLRQQCKCGGMGRCYCPCADLIDPQVQRANTSKEPTP